MTVYLPCCTLWERGRDSAAFSSFIELSVQGTATRYYLFPDFSPRDDFQFSVLVHIVVKIFRLEVSEQHWAFCGFLSTHVPCTHPVEEMGCSGPRGPAVWPVRLNSIKWGIGSVCHTGCLGRGKSRTRVCGWACALITSPKNDGVQNLAGACSKEK